MHQRARTDLRGGRGETRVPTATFGCAAAELQSRATFRFVLEPARPAEPRCVRQHRIEDRL